MQKIIPIFLITFVLFYVPEIKASRSGLFSSRGITNPETKESIYLDAVFANDEESSALVSLDENLTDTKEDKRKDKSNIADLSKELVYVVNSELKNFVVRASKILQKSDGNDNRLKELYESIVRALEDILIASIQLADNYSEELS